MKIFKSKILYVVALVADLGEVTQIYGRLKTKDENGNVMDISVVDVVNNLDDKVGSGDFSDTKYVGNKEDGICVTTSVTEAIHHLDAVIGQT